MRSTFFWLLSFGGFAAVSLLCGILVWPQLVAAWPGIEEKIDRFRRLPPLAKLVLLLFVGAFVVYGSTKTNQVDQTSGTNVVEIADGGTNDVEIAEGDETNAPPMMLMMAMPFTGDRSPTVTPEDIARGWKLWEVRTNCNLSYTMPDDATLATNWWVRGAYEDVKLFDFCSWRFPFGTNEYSSLWAFSWGKLRFALADTNTEIVAVGAPMSAVPYHSRLWSAADTNGARLITWENFALNRNTNTPVNAQVELWSTGDFIVRSNEVETVYRRVDDFDWDGDGILNWSDWDPYWYDGDYTGQDESYREWVDECVGTGLENGYYKLTATFPQEGFRRTVLSVGWEEIVVAEPGEYVFLLEKGEDYDIGLVPFVDGVGFEALDDIPAAGGLRMPLTALAGHWDGKWSRDDGDLYLTPPQPGEAGCVIWTPKLQVSPDGWNPSVGDLSETFTAMLFDRTDWMTEPTYSWSSANNSVAFGSPAAMTSRATWQMGPQETVSAHLIVTFGDRQLESTLGFTYHDGDAGDGEDDDGFSFRMSVSPDTMFVNNDDDNDDGQEDFWSMSSDDDWGSGRIELRSSVKTNGTIMIDNRDGFDGIIRDESYGKGNVGKGTEWDVTDEYGKEINLSFNAFGRSDCFEGSQVKVRWIPVSGIEKTFVRRFTVVEPVVAPICSERKTVMRDGVEHRLVYNPSGVVIGKDAYFKITVAPDDYPDSKIRWQAVGAGAVEFVGGDTGREVRVRGVTEGDVTLEISIGDCQSAKPTFSVRVVENVSVKMDVCILCYNNVSMRTESEVRSMLPLVNDIYEQVGITFYIDSILFTNINAACRALYEGDTVDGHWSFDDVAHILPDAGGLKCYFIDSFVDTPDTCGANGVNGILLTKVANEVSWAHEIGHACGLEDIYDEHNGQSIPSEETFEWRHAIDDWNNGSAGLYTKGSRYYQKNLKRRELVKRLLMYGYDSSGKADVSSGYVDGIVNIGSDRSCPGPARTGLFATGGIHPPLHQRKHNNGVQQ